MTNRKLEAVVFDKDGVLVDTEPLKAEAHKQSLARFGIPDGDDWYYRHLGTAGIEMARMQIEEFNLAQYDPKITPESFRALKEDRILPRLIRQFPATPIKSGIDFLKSIPPEYKLAVASSDYKIRIKQDLQGIGVYDLFDVIVSGAEDVFSSKPAPHVYLMAAEKLGVDPQNCLAVEDTPQGIESAKLARMKCIVHRMPHNRYLDLSEADLVVDDLSVLDLDKDILTLF